MSHGSLTEPNSSEPRLSGHTRPSLLDALVPICALIIMLVIAVYLFSSDSSSGANQIALLLAACIAMIIGYKNGYSWSQMEWGIVKSIGSSWTVAGTLDEAEFSPDEITP